MNYLIKNILYPSAVFRKYQQGGQLEQPLNIEEPGDSPINDKNPDKLDLSIEQFVSMLPEHIKKNAMSKPEVLNKIYHKTRAAFNAELAKDIEHAVRNNKITNKRKLASDLYTKKLQELKNRLTK